MTEQHPLTDETCEDLSSCITILTAPGDPDPYICPQYIADDMRAAADWQLKQVIEWLKSNLHQEYYLEYSWDSEYRNKGVAEIDVDSVVEDLREAMRPTTTTETP